MRFCNSSLVICELDDTNSRGWTGLWVKKWSEAFEWDLLPVPHSGMYNWRERSQSLVGVEETCINGSGTCTEEPGSSAPLYLPSDSIFKVSWACKGQWFPLAGRQEMSIWGWYVCVYTCVGVTTEHSSEMASEALLGPANAHLTIVENSPTRLRCEWSWLSGWFGNESRLELC